MFNRANGNMSSELMMTMFPQRSPHTPGATSQYLAPLPPPHHPRAFKTATSMPSDLQLPDEHRSMHCSLDCRESSGTASDEYKQLWLQACHLPVGKEESHDISKIGDNGDFRVWRNFSNDLGFDLATIASGRSRRSAAIANCYPVRVPPPSSMGDSSLSVYLESSGAVRQKFSQQLAQMHRFETRTAAQLASLASVRRPSLDSIGRIKPPPGYKRYPQARLPKPSQDPDPDFTEVITADMQPDLFGKLVKKRPPRLWKLSYKSGGEAKGQTIVQKKSRPELLKSSLKSAVAADCVLAPSGARD